MAIDRVEVIDQNDPDILSNGDFNQATKSPLYCSNAPTPFCRYIDNQYKGFSYVLNLIPSCIIFMDAITETMTFLNKRGRELLGFDCTGATISSFAARIKAYSADGARLTLEDLPIRRSQLLGETVRNREFRLESESGTAHSLLVNSAPILDPEGKIVAAVSIFEDITEQKETQSQLYSFENNYRTMVETASEGIWWCDCRGMITYANEVLANWLGFSARELVGMYYYDFVLPEDMEKTVVSWKKKQSLNHYRADFRLKKRDGSHIWVIISSTALRDPMGAYAGSLTMFTDITERKRMESQLSFHSHVLSNVQEAICALDGNYRITYWNKVAEEMYGWTAEEAMGKYLSHILNTVMKDITVQELSRKLQNTDSICTDVTHYRKDGTPIHVSAHLHVVRDAKGDIAEIIVSLRDITQRKRMEEILIRSEMELRSNEKLKDEFITILSHELRNPLAALSAGIELMDFSEDAMINREHLDIMRRQTEQLNQIVSDLLDISRLMRNKIKLRTVRIELNDTVLTIAKAYRVLFRKKGVSLRVRPVPRPVYLNADPIRLEQCVGNLLHNALKFSNKGDRVTVSITCKNTAAQISISDAGCGIRPELISELFEPFRQALSSEKDGSGLGLGLSIAKGIAELHGGRLEAQSDGPGKGSCFTVVLPVLQIPYPIKEKELSNKTGSLIPLKILLIEDNKDFVSLVSAMLTQMNHSVSAAYDGISGLREAKEYKPDIIFCDIGLPGMNGFEVAKKIKTDPRLEDIVLVALSSFASRNDIRLGEESGFDVYLPKPISMKKLKELLQGIGSRSE